LAERTGRAGGTIRMTAPKTPGSRFLGTWLAQFLRQHPAIQIELDLNDRLVNLPEQGYDLALRVGPLADSSLVARPLGSSERLLVAAPDCIARHGRPVSLAQLEELPCIGFGEQRSGRGTWVLLQGKRSQSVRFDPVLRCDDMATTLQACLGGAGVALIPSFVCRDALQSGALQRILPEWSGPSAQFYLVYPDRRLMPARVQRLVEFLIERGKSAGAQL
ncbi:MAG: substrate binding domain-containing protein, partial [Gammaproteobacteria bacterium]